MAQAKDNALPPGSYKTIFEMLKDVPGLDVRTSNDKSGGSVVVRGIGSLNNQRSPLIVVDGMVYNGDISNINTQDIAGISVLKDAASATSYGAQGAFGVILITTKNGTGLINRPKVSSHAESAYTYFIEHHTPLKLFGKDQQLILKVSFIIKMTVHWSLSKRKRKR